MSYLDDMFGLTGKNVVMTGGSGVLAGSMAEALLRAGAAVSLWGRHAETLKDAAARVAEAAGIGGTPERVSWAVVDAMSEEAVETAVVHTVEKHGRIDILINAVGGNKSKNAFVDTDLAQFEEILRLNLIAGLMIPTKVVARHWIGRKVRGTVINIASMSSFVPLSGVWAYDAAKAGVLNLTMAAAREFAPHGIRVNALAPGFFVGKQNRALLMNETGELTPRGRDIISRTPMGRFGQPRELAAAVVYLASDAASGFVTGVCLPVDGGFLVDCV